MTLAAVAAWRALHVPAPERPGSLAVLPFRPLAATAEDDAILGLGIADALILKLSAVTRLVVRPTSAVVRIAPGDEARASGRRLGVDYVIEGHLQRSGQALRVTAQLLSVETGAALWSDRFEVEASDVFRVQDAIAERAAASLLRSLSRDERKLLARRDTAIPEARLAYVRGRYLWSRRTESALEASVVQFQRALDLDPRYALAASGLADAYNLLGAYGSRVPRASFERAMAAARSALDIDETVAEAHASLAFAIAHHDHDWERAEREYRRALELAPGYATALQWLALCFAAQGRFDDAIATSRRAAEADPLSPIIATDVGRHLYYARRYPAAIEQLRAAVELDPTFARAHQELGRAYRQYGLADLAVAELTRAVALSDRASAPLAELASARAAVGDARGARAIADELERRARGWDVRVPLPLRRDRGRARGHGARRRGAARGVRGPVQLDRVRRGRAAVRRAAVGTRVPGDRGAAARRRIASRRALTPRPRGSSSGRRMGDRTSFRRAAATHRPPPRGCLPASPARQRLQRSNWWISR